MRPICSPERRCVRVEVDGAAAGGGDGLVLDRHGVAGVRVARAREELTVEPQTRPADPGHAGDVVRGVAGNPHGADRIALRIEDQNAAGDAHYPAVADHAEHLHEEEEESHAHQPSGEESRADQRREEDDGELGSHVVQSLTRK